MSQIAADPDLWEQLVDVEDPVLPDVIEPLRKMNEEEARESDAQLSVVATVLAVLSALALWYGSIFWTVLLAVGTAVTIAVKYGTKSLVGRCPFCSARLDTIEGMDGAEVRCPSCSDYSIVEGMQIRPLENPAEPDGLRFTSPLYKDSRWPRGCVACGASPDRLEEVSGETVQASSLLVGRLVVAKGKAPGVPYCSAHKDALEVRSTQGLELELRWSSLKMMRRYLAANRGCVTPC